MDLCWNPSQVDELYTQRCIIFENWCDFTTCCVISRFSGRHNKKKWNGWYDHKIERSELWQPSQNVRYWTLWKNEAIQGYKHV